MEASCTQLNSNQTYCSPSQPRDCRCRTDSYWLRCLCYVLSSKYWDIQTDWLNFCSLAIGLQSQHYTHWRFQFPNWSLLLSGNSASSNLFCDFVFDCNLTQLVTGPTHSKGNCLDLVLSNTPEAVNTVNASQIPRFNTDHYLVSFLLSTHVRTSSAASKTQYAIDYSKLDI